MEILKRRDASYLKTASYDYTLPEELIATEPAEPRESARLMVIDRRRDRIVHARFRDILDFIPTDTAILYNDTKVIKARLFGRKESGGKIELLINKPLPDDRFEVMIKGRVKEGTRLIFDERFHGVVLACLENGGRIVRFFDDKAEALSFEGLLSHLDRLGHVPLPPYIRRADRQEDRHAYQPVFAQKEGAVAAPTASLHFSDTLFENLKKRHETASITLHVGAGTFKPVEAEIITDHPMHSEYYEIPSSAAELIESGVPLMAIGTTVTRTVEHYVRTKKRFGECDLFLHPGNPPRRVDTLLTNFHLPKSTLLMLVASFLGVERTKRVYNIAITEHYRFYSYGDAMLIV